MMVIVLRCFLDRGSKSKIRKGTVGAKLEFYGLLFADGDVPPPRDLFWPSTFLPCTLGFAVLHPDCRCVRRYVLVKLNVKTI
jgi:hypothetical protein